MFWVFEKQFDRGLPAALKKKGKAQLLRFSFLLFLDGSAGDRFNSKSCG
ncbi:MAG: hypothetical protein ACRC62_06045 [Microcoleus sp.]